MASAIPDDAVPSYAEIGRGLRAAWFPVARSVDIDRPQCATVLDEALVCFRGEDGRAAVLARRCVHRGGDLAVGKIIGDCIECPYHGWRYNADGACALIPALGEDARIPPNAKVVSYPARERFGLVWTCIGDPLVDVPALPELEPLGMTFLAGAPIDIAAGLVAAIENFRDVAHFPFVHSRSMGQVEPRIERLEVRTDGFETWIERKYSATAGAAAVYRDKTDITFTYHAVVPSLASALLDEGEAGHRVVFECFCPVTSTGGCRIFMVSGVARDYTGASAEEALAAELDVLSEDKVILDSLTPLEVPLHREEPEVSVLSDRYTLATRRTFLTFVRHALAATNGSAPGAGNAELASV